MPGDFSRADPMTGAAVLRARRLHPMPDSSTTVAELRQAMARFVHERDWEQFHSPKNLVMALAAEAAELMEHFLWIDNDASRALVRDEAQRGPIADEIADVAGVIFAL